MPRPLLLIFNSSVPKLEKLVCDARHIRSLAAASNVRSPPIAMSALGQKQTFALQQVMSALPPKADMCSALAYVRFVPIADIRSVWTYRTDCGPIRSLLVKHFACVFSRIFLRACKAIAHIPREALVQPHVQN
jgi:hypothetical protein